MQVHMSLFLRLFYYKYKCMLISSAALRLTAVIQAVLQVVRPPPLAARPASERRWRQRGALEPSARVGPGPGYSPRIHLSGEHPVFEAVLWEVISNLSKPSWGAAAPHTPRLILGGSRPADPRWGGAAPQTSRFVLGYSPPRSPKEGPGRQAQWVTDTICT